MSLWLTCVGLTLLYCLHLWVIFGFVMKDKLIKKKTLELCLQLPHIKKHHRSALCSISDYTVSRCSHLWRWDRQISSVIVHCLVHCQYQGGRKIFFNKLAWIRKKNLVFSRNGELLLTLVYLLEWTKSKETHAILTIYLSRVLCLSVCDCVCVSQFVSER